MNPVYTFETKQIAEKRYLIGYSLARESDGYPKGHDEMAGPMPQTLYTENYQPCWVVQDDGTLLYDPAPPSPGLLLRRELTSLQEYFAQTDWYIIRKADSGKDPPEEVVANRQRARNRISDIRDQLDVGTSKNYVFRLIRQLRCAHLSTQVLGLVY